MAKQRIEIYGLGLKLMKNIVSIKINGNIYDKIDYSTPLDIQRFYKFINQNRMNIEWLSYRDYVSNENFEVYVKNLKLHNEFGPAKITRYLLREDKSYYLKGRYLGFNEWNIKLRKNKLLKLGAGG